LKHRHAALVALLILFSVYPVAYAATPVRYRYTLAYRFENRGTESVELYREDVAIPLFLDTEWQEVDVTESDTPLGETLTDEDGNSWVVVDVPLTLGPGEEASFTVTYSIESSDKPRPEISLSAAEGLDSIPSELVKTYTDPTETFMSEDQRVSQIAHEMAEGDSTALGAVVNMIDWLAANTEYCNFEVPRYPNQTAADGLGDCDDQSILLVSMCRSLGIPAYLQVGIVIHPSIVDSETSWEGHLTDSRDGVGWHAWAMIYVPPWGWLPVDLTLVQEDGGLEVLAGAPEYGSNIVPCFNVNRQAYIGESLATRARFIDSTIYVEIADEAERMGSRIPMGELYLVAGLGIAVTAAIVLMFVSDRRANPAGVTARS
jgi:transglutaminase-like putative cysteine protease